MVVSNIHLADYCLFFTGLEIVANYSSTCQAHFQGQTIKRIYHFREHQDEQGTAKLLQYHQLFLVQVLLIGIILACKNLTPCPAFMDVFYLLDVKYAGAAGETFATEQEEDSEPGVLLIRWRRSVQGWGG